MPRGGERLRDGRGRVNGLGERVRERRRTLRLTQPDLCARIDVATEGRWIADRQDILRIENGTRTVTDLEIKILALALECRAGWLLLGEAEDLAHKWQ